MESPGQKVLYEIRHHASLPYVPRNPPLPQVLVNSRKSGANIGIRGKIINQEESLWLSLRASVMMITRNTVAVLQEDDDGLQTLTKPCLKTEASVNQALPDQVADVSSRLTNTGGT
ncbi:unnamed protein product [Brassica oleracea var. botrytis]